MHVVYPGCQGTWIGIAFRTGDPKNIKEDLIMGATWGPFVHSEIILGKNEVGRSYSAFDNRCGFTISNSVYKKPHWKILKFPLVQGGYEKTYAMILQMLALNIAYNSHDLWQCCVQIALPFETELDCDQPETWKGGVFCSQVSLLLLRRMMRNNLIATNPTLKQDIESIHSRGCSPNTLFGILKQNADSM